MFSLLTSQKSESPLHDFIIIEGVVAVTGRTLLFVLTL